MRKLLKLGGVLLLAGVVVTGCWLARPDPPGPGVTWANASRIEVGMTEAEVMAIVGGRHLILPPIHRGLFGMEQQTDAIKLIGWPGTECDITVCFDLSGRVVAKEAHGPPPPTWFDRARRRLGL